MLGVQINKVHKLFKLFLVLEDLFAFSKQEQKNLNKNRMFKTTKNKNKKIKIFQEYFLTIIKYNLLNK